MKGLYYNEVHREPDRSPPVRVAAEEARARFARLVADLVGRSADTEHVRLVGVCARTRAPPPSGTSTSSCSSIPLRTGPSWPARTIDRSRRSPRPGVFMHATLEI